MKFSVVLLGVLPGILSVVLSGSALAQNDNVTRGEYLARLGNCVACHTVEGGAPFAGGLKMHVPGLGNIYSTNITPDPDTGIGGYSLQDFDNAMRLGVAKDGHHLYPAMPYPSYAKITSDDMQALYDYFMQAVAPVRQPNRANEIPAPQNARWPLAVWNALQLDEDRFQPEPTRSESWNRGAYLVQGLGHCGACHTPRGWMMQELGTDESSPAFLSGAQLDHWYASSLNGDPNSGLGRWSQADIVAFLKTGKNRFGKAFGTMVEVVNNSTAHMTDADLNAMAEYLKSLPALNEMGVTEYQYDPASTETLLRFDFSAAGAQEYYQNCMHCHGADGIGQAAYIPPLAGNPVLMDPDPASLINITLNGSLRVVLHGQPEPYDMPAYRLLLDDQQTAAVVTYIRTAWGNLGTPVTAAAVATIRAATDTAADDVVVLRMK
ncbi:cytochrome c [Ketobacter sp.]|uniref:cytochrome c n=1 Tax=Ketobacter sp. TaxID=2083498 RepID=UPI000F142DF6|nr:cytochrome c [Ketobacter sp.]RLT96829.1 MAG: cytochrome c [Ketobacter sp.]